MRRPLLVLTASLALLAVLLAPAASAQDARDDQETLRILTEEVARLLDEARDLRALVARLEMENRELDREVAEMRAFVSDHARFGDSFEEYRRVKEVAVAEARQRLAAEARTARQKERDDRRARYAAARAAREQRTAETVKLEDYRKRGFAPIGLDVYASRMAFHYRTFDHTPVEVEYEPIFGRYLELGRPVREVDFSRMTISGSIVNGGDGTRNVGVAITFFDERGNQAGHEIIQVENARPGVPYPFTTTIDMALDRPFDSASTYVLYADPIVSEH
jgi:hypothetical protein